VSWIAVLLGIFGGGRRATCPRCGRRQLRGRGATRGRALHQIESFHEKSTRALKKRDQARADRLRRTRDALFPGGSFQERGLSTIGAFCRHGAKGVEEIAAKIDPWARGHQVIPV